MQLRGMRASAWMVAGLVSLSACTAVPAAQPSPSGDPSPASAGLHLPTATAAATSAPTASADAARGTAPISAGAVPDAGVLFVLGTDDPIYRYDGATGALQRLWGKSSFGRETAAGASVLGRHGGAALLRWDGTTAEVACGTGYVWDVSASGACVSTGDDGVFIKLPSDTEPRQLLPQDWGGGGVALSPKGDRLLVVRNIRPRPGPGMDPGLAALWLMDREGRLREIYRPKDQGTLGVLAWSPDGRYALFREVSTTSNSFAADGVGISTLVVDLESGVTSSLGGVMGGFAWAPDGRLAFVRGSGRLSWDDRHLIVREPSGSEREIVPAGPVERVALLPAWDSAGERLAWISGPKTSDYSGGRYIDGTGAGQRVVVIMEGSDQREVACAEGRVAEGVRWSTDGSRLLLLCRKVGRHFQPLELWLHRLADRTSSPLVTELGGGWTIDPGSAGFGFYGQQPGIRTLAAWSLAAD